jgi:MFS superfamily sulfate permease-like transporter
MAGGKTKGDPGRTRVGERELARGLNETFLGLNRRNFPSQLLAGITLLAIAIPEQLATAQLAGVPAFTAMIAFIAATLVFCFAGSNPILSVGADSTIAPLFAVALLKLALPASSQYYALVAATALVTGLLVMAVGLLKLGWLADFLSAPIVAGFLSGIGVIIIVHQLPRVFGVTGGGDSVVQRLNALFHNLGHISTWSLVISLGTLAVMVVGEKINARLPWALVGVLVATILASALSLSAHGVQELGTVIVGAPTWRIRLFGLHEWSVVVTTSITLLVVIMSQSAATARTSADEIGVADNLSRDFVGIGLANVATGMLGSFPVNASPARTTISRLAGGRTKMVGLVAALGALVLSPLATYAHAIPLAALAGVLLFVAGRLIKIVQLKTIFATSHAEFILAALALLGVVFLGVELGLAIAVGLAILEQMWRAARPRMVELGKRHGTTSWEPITTDGVHTVDHILVVFFDEDLFYANAGVFRRELHDHMQKNPKSKHVILDAVAMSDIDYTALLALSQIVNDLMKDEVTVSIARANANVKSKLSKSTDTAISHIGLFDSVDAAASDALGSSKD